MHIYYCLKRRHHHRGTVMLIGAWVGSDIVAGCHNDRQFVDDFTGHWQKQKDIIDRHWTCYVRQLSTRKHHWLLTTTVTSIELCSKCACFDNDVTRQCHYHIRALKHITSLPTQEASKTFVVTTVGSKLDYCNCVLYGISRHVDVPGGAPPEIVFAPRISLDLSSN